MNLWQLRRHWDALAEADPYYAVPTESAKQGNRWAADESFMTGVADVDGDMARVRAVEPGLPLRHALDFGCGAGRPTQARRAISRA